MVPAPGELPVATWLLDHGWRINGSFEEHTHDFPGLAYIETTGGLLRTGRQTWPIEAGDLYVIAPGDVMGKVHTGRSGRLPRLGRVLHRRRPGPRRPRRLPGLAHPPAAVPVRARRRDRRAAAAGSRADRPEWSARIQALHDELTARRDGYREAALAHLVLLLVGVSRLAADVVDDLRERTRNRCSPRCSR
jgi:hypothetical protein